MEETKIDTTKQTEEEKAKIEAEQAAAKLAVSQGLCQKLEACLDGFRKTLHFEAWKKQGGPLNQLQDEILKLFTLVSGLDFSEQMDFQDECIEKMKSARSSLLSSKKGVFFEGLTLFPLGIFIQTRIGDACSAYLLDKGLTSGLEELVSSCEAFKTFTSDNLLKEKALSNGEKDFEIQIPAMSKVGDFVAKHLDFHLGYC